MKPSEHPEMPFLRELERQRRALVRKPGGRSQIGIVTARIFALEGAIMKETGASLLRVQIASGAL